MATGPMQFGADNNAGPTPPNETILRTQGLTASTLLIQNERGAVAVPGVPGRGLTVEGGSGVLGQSTSTGNGVEGRSRMRNGVEGYSSSVAASGVYGENTSAGGFGVAGRSYATMSAPMGGSPFSGTTPPEAGPASSVGPSTWAGN